MNLSHITTIVALFASTNAFAEQKLIFDINLEGSQVDYNVKTHADSILKWRGSKGLGGNITASYLVTDKLKTSLRYSYTSLNGGAMSDYDLENLYPYDTGVFSEATKMKGSYQTYAVDFHYLLTDSPSGIFGYEYKKLELNPSNVYQVAYNAGGSDWVYKNPEDSQNTKFALHGINLGLDYKINSYSTQYGITATAFLPIIYKSYQYNWGYNNDGGWDWKIAKDQIDIDNLGYKLKLYHQHKLSEQKDLWLNTYVEIESIYIKDAIEVDRNDTTLETIGSIKYARLNRFAFGVGLSF